MRSKTKNMLSTGIEIFALNTILKHLSLNNISGNFPLKRSLTRSALFSIKMSTAILRI